MKNFPLLDALFILLSAAVFMAIDHFGYAYIISKYAVVVAIIAYFIGKYIGQVELRKKNKTKTH